MSSTSPNIAKKSPVHVKHDGNAPVVCHGPDQVGRIVTTEAEAYVACYQLEQNKSNLLDRMFSFVSAMGQVKEWSERTERVQSVSIGATGSHVMVVVTAVDEDESGDLHDSMTDLEIELNNQYGLGLDFLLLRAKEGLGLASLIEPAKCAAVYRRAH